MAASSTAETMAAAVLVFAVLPLLFLVTSSCQTWSNTENMTAGEIVSLETVLRNISNRDSSEKCFVVNLLPMSHVLSQRLTIRGNVVLTNQSGSASEGRPSVSCSIPPPNLTLLSSSADTQDLAALTFRGSRHVGIEGLVFENCPLGIQFLEVEEVTISTSLFR